MFPQTHTSSTITPQKTDNGRHVVKLLLNGAWRSVLIDALLPRSNGTKLPLHATSHPEGTVAQKHSIGPPWIPLILKGYFKAYGGYSLRGSNPAPDIYTLTGWIPERIHLRGGLQREKEWKRIFGSWKRGEVIVTIGTGSRDSLGDGLIPYHAYAILGEWDLMYRVGSLYQIWLREKTARDCSRFMIRALHVNMQKSCISREIWQIVCKVSR